MIVRVGGEGQFRIDGGCAERLNALDNEAVAAVEARDESRLRELLGRMIDIVRADGAALADDELVPSDVILPPADSTLEEVRDEFTGEGLIPD